MIRLHTPLAVPIEGRLDYKIGEFDVSVRSELGTVLEDFANLYKGYPSGSPNSAEPIQVGVHRLKRSPLQRERYQILGGGDEIGSERRREEVIPFLEWGINWCLISTRADFLQLHAATMAKDGKGIVLAASSGGGKSTLVAGLMARGWTLRDCQRTGTAVRRATVLCERAEGSRRIHQPS